MAILATGVARLFDLSQEGGLRDDGGLFGETVFVFGGILYYLPSFSMFEFISFLSIALFPRRRVSSANPGRTALVVSL